MEKYNYVTLFNVNYLSRGLVMYHSLKAAAKDFTLYVVCFDDATYKILKDLHYPDLVPISLAEFENEDLLRVKPGRTAAEYCWTCSSSVIWHCVKTFQLDNCAYIDADMYFYADPARIWKEDPTASVYITLHNYSPAYDQSLVSGRFCVQFVGFKNTPEGMTVLKEWKDDCIAWCFNRVEDGKFGDQKYLDAWPGKYKGVHIVKDITAGLAPWNIQQFRVLNAHQVIQKNNGEKKDPLFFHFHGLKIYQERLVSFVSSYYDISGQAQDVFYRPYAKKLLDTEEWLSKTFASDYKVSFQPAPLEAFNLWKWLRFYIYDIRQDAKNINPKFTNNRFANNYTYKIHP